MLYTKLLPFHLFLCTDEKELEMRIQNFNKRGLIVLFYNITFKTLV